MRERGSEGARERGSEGARERGREGAREGARERAIERGREGGSRMLDEGRLMTHARRYTSMRAPVSLVDLLLLKSGTR
jgi:Mg-chelatase subunit ChlD